MPELSPKGFNKLSRTIGSGSAGPPGKARTPVFDAGDTTCREPGPAYADAADGQVRTRPSVMPLSVRLSFNERFK